MKTSKLLAITTIALAFSMSNAAFSKDLSIAVVDVQKIIESSPEICALKADRKNKVNSLASYVEKARTDVTKEPNATKKKTLEETYTKEINVRKEALDKAYVQKLSDVDKNITALIKTKTANYDLVLTKNSVLSGGVDITSDIIKELK